MGRYTLTMQTYGNQSIKMPFNENGRKATKVSLWTIDKLTTDSKNEEDFLNSIGKCQKVNDVTITYLNNRELKSVPVAYQDKKALTEVTLNKENKINIDNNVFKKNIYMFLQKLEDRNFFEFSMNSSLLTDKQKEYITIRIEYGNYKKFYEDKIITHSSSYRQFRNILFLIEEYELMKMNKCLEKESTTEPEDEHDPDLDHIYSEEEKQEFQAYLDNLPDEIPDYILMDTEDEKQKVKRV